MRDVVATNAVDIEADQTAAFHVDTVDGSGFGAARDDPPRLARLRECAAP